jgi:pilus assembly protein CpaF
MGHAGNAVTTNDVTPFVPRTPAARRCETATNLLPPNGFYGLESADLDLLTVVQLGILNGSVRVPAWGEADAGVQRMFRDTVRQILRSHVRPAELEDKALRLADSLCGIGLLEQFLREPEVEEIYVRHGEVAIERGGMLQRNVIHAPDAYWENLVKHVADARGQEISPRHRAVLVDLPSGERFTGLLPPLSDGPAINIRRYGAKGLGIQDLRAFGAFDQYEPRLTGNLDDILDRDLRERVARLPEGSIDRFLAWVVAAQAGNIVFAGEFSSGKTTLLNAISQYFPPNAPIAILETFKELQPPERLFQMRAIAPSMLLPGQEEVATMDWVLNVVYTRTNPAAILLSEIVSPGEAMQFLMAANLGRRAYSTIHGGTVAAALRRLEKFALQDQSEIGREVVRELIVGGVNLVVHLARNPQDGRVFRFVAEVALVTGMAPDGTYQLETLYSGWKSEQGMGAAHLLHHARENL